MTGGAKVAEGGGVGMGWPCACCDSKIACCHSTGTDGMLSEGSTLSMTGPKVGCCIPPCDPLPLCTWTTLGRWA